MPYRTIRSECAVLAQVAQEYKYFDRTTSKNGFIEVFNIDHCEVCGREIKDVNGIKIGAPSHELRAMGMEHRDMPEEGGYSELHECSTCPECCYDEHAGEKTVVP